MFDDDDSPGVRHNAESYASSPLFNFTPWFDEHDRSPQLEFLMAAATHRRRIFRAGNQAGKTTIEVVDALLRLLGWHPWARSKPPVWGWLSALDWEFGVGQVLWPKMHEWLPWNAVRSVVWYRRGEPSIPETLIFRNDSRLDFKSAEAGRKKFQGAVLDFAGVDEEQPEDIIEEIKVRLIKKGGDFFAGLTPVRRERWVLEMERGRDCAVIRASSKAAAKAGILNVQAVDDLADSLPDRQRAVRIEGDFSRLEGVVYPEFAPATHCVTPVGNGLFDGAGRRVADHPIPSDWPRYAAIDFGFANPTAIVVVAESPAGVLFVERCYYRAGVRASLWGDMLRNGILPPLTLPLVADHDASERDELAAKGWPTVPAEKDVVRGIEAVERRFHNQRKYDGPGLYLVVHALSDFPRHPEVGRCDAERLAWELEGYRYPEQVADATKDVKDQPLKRNDHACDALRYLVIAHDSAFRIEAARVVPTAAPAPVDVEDTDRDDARSRLDGFTSKGRPSFR